MSDIRTHRINVLTKERDSLYAIIHNLNRFVYSIGPLLVTAIGGGATIIFTNVNLSASSNASVRMWMFFTLSQLLYYLGVVLIIAYAHTHVITGYLAHLETKVNSLVEYKALTRSEDIGRPLWNFSRSEMLAAIILSFVVAAVGYCLLMIASIRSGFGLHDSCLWLFICVIFAFEVIAFSYLVIQTVRRAMRMS